MMIVWRIFLFWAPALVISFHGDFRNERFKREQVQSTSTIVSVSSSSPGTVFTHSNAKSMLVGVELRKSTFADIKVSGKELKTSTTYGHMINVKNTGNATYASNSTVSDPARTVCSFIASRST